MASSRGRGAQVLLRLQMPVLVEHVQEHGQDRKVDEHPPRPTSDPRPNCPHLESPCGQPVHPQGSGTDHRHCLSWGYPAKGRGTHGCGGLANRQLSGVRLDLPAGRQTGGGFIARYRRLAVTLFIPGGNRWPGPRLCAIAYCIVAEQEKEEGSAPNRKKNTQQRQLQRGSHGTAGYEAAPTLNMAGPGRGNGWGTGD